MGSGSAPGGERTLKFRVDLINALNRSGVGGLVTDVSSPNFGRLFGVGIGARRPAVAESAVLTQVAA